MVEHFIDNWKTQFNTEKSTDVPLKYPVWTFCPFQTECGGVYTEHSGVISSANYPGEYDSDSMCYYLIQVCKQHVKIYKGNDL